MNSYFWATPSGPINLMKAEDMPVYPRNCYGKPYCCPGERCKQLAYKEVLEAAKESSVPIQDQEMAKKLIGEQIASLNPGAVGPTFIQPGAIYGPFTVEYRIEMDVCHADKETGGCDSRECCLRSAVAILYDNTPEKEPQEDQETLWHEVDRIFNVKWTFGMPDDVMQELKEKFTITRKQ